LVDLPGYGHASVRAETRESWGPLGDALLERESFAAMVLVVDVRRGVGDLDLGMIEWAGLPPEALHVLLTKADKLPSGQAKKALREAEAALAGQASCQLFSALKGTGLEEGRSALRRLMAAEKK
jgi:GTP-binding protein